MKKNQDVQYEGLIMCDNKGNPCKVIYVDKDNKTFEILVDKSKIKEIPVHRSKKFEDLI